MRPALYTGLACVLCASLYGLFMHRTVSPKPALPETAALVPRSPPAPLPPRVALALQAASAVRRAGRPC